MKLQGHSLPQRIVLMDERGKCYPVIDSLEAIRLGDKRKFSQATSLFINHQEFSINDHLGSFLVSKNSSYVNLKTLPMISKEPLSVFHLRLSGKTEQEIEFIYASRSQILSAPNGSDSHLEVRLGDMLLSAPYQRQGKRSNLSLLIEGKRYFLILK